MTQHLERGHRDGRVLSRQELLRAQVPINAQKACARAKRPWLGEVNKKHRAWLHAHPGADRDEKRAAFSAAIASCRQECPELFAPEATHEDTHSVPVQDDAGALWKVHSDLWPLTPEMLDHELRRASAESTGTCDSRCGRLRGLHIDKLFVEGTKAIPESMSFDVRLPCPILHHGLCATKDVGILDDATQMAKSLEQFFTTARVARFWKLTCDHALDPIFGLFRSFEAAAHACADQPCVC